MQLSDIAIYAVRESDGALAGFSFSAEPGTAEPGRYHTPIERDAPGSALYLIGYATHAEATAHVHGLEMGCCSDDAGWLVHTFADDLTCVLVDFTRSPGDTLHLEDMRNAPAAGHDTDDKEGGAS